MQLRPLGILKEMLEENGEDVSYTYEDLVFTEHNVFLIQFDDKNPADMKLFLNSDCEEKAGLEILAKMKRSAVARQCTVSLYGSYELFQEEGQNEFQVRFL